MRPSIVNVSAPALSLYFVVASPISSNATVTVRLPASAESNVFVAVKSVPSVSVYEFSPSVKPSVPSEIVPPSVVPS